GLELPDNIFIYRDNLIDFAEDRDHLREEIVITIVHEIAHFYGIDDERLHELGSGCGPLRARGREGYRHVTVRGGDWRSPRRVAYSGRVIHQHRYNNSVRIDAGAQDHGRSRAAAPKVSRGPAGRRHYPLMTVASKPTA